MILINGDFHEAKYKVTLWCATTNSDKDKNGHLVMGKGTASVMKLTEPWIARAFGGMVTTPLYGLLVYRVRSDHYYGAFQTKYSWRQKSTLELVRYSTIKLFEWLLAHPTATVALPFPGINNGGLKREDVLPIISLLPDNVRVYERSHNQSS